MGEARVAASFVPWEAMRAAPFEAQILLSC